MLLSVIRCYGPKESKHDNGKSIGLRGIRAQSGAEVKNGGVTTSVTPTSS
jgi:hypothetical protein